MPTAEFYPNNLRISDAGIALLKRFTPLQHTPRKASCGIDEIGYGHILRPVDHHLTLVNEAQAEQLMREDVRVLEIYLNSTFRVSLLPHQFDALISLIWDIGIVSFERSPIRAYINAGMFSEAVQSWRVGFASWKGSRFGAQNLEVRYFEAAHFSCGAVNTYGHPEVDHFSTFVQ